MSRDSNKKQDTINDELFRLLDRQALLIHKATLEQHHNREFTFDDVIDLEDRINDCIGVKDLYKYKRSQGFEEYKYEDIKDEM